MKKNANAEPEKELEEDVEEEESDDEEDEEDSEEVDEDEDEEKSEDESEDDLDPEKFKPEPRKRPWENRQERDEYFKNLNKGKKKEADKEKDEEDGDDDPDDRPVTRKELNTFMRPIIEQADAAEVDTFLGNPKNAKFTKFAPLAKKYMSVHPTVPVSDAFKIVAFNEASRMGAEKSKKVEDKDKRQKQGGTSKRTATSQVPDFSKMTTAQLEKFNQRVAQGERFKPDEE